MISDEQENQMSKEEEKKNHRFSFMVGIYIGMAIIILLVLITYVPAWISHP